MSDVNWKDWYFERARREATDREHEFFFDTIRPGCSDKQLAQISKGVLDIEDPHDVHWRDVRPAHVWLKRDKLDHRTLLAAMSNFKRIVSKGLQRRLHPFFLQALGWYSNRTVKVPEILRESDYLAIEAAALDGLDEQATVGMRAYLRMQYYAGFTQPGLRTLTTTDVIHVDGRTLVYRSGKLYELPDHVRLPLIAWQRIRNGDKRATNGKKGIKLFSMTFFKAADKLNKLHETFIAIKRLSA